MGVQKQTLSPGNGVDFPKKNDTVTMEYTGWLYDPSKPDNKGSQYVLWLLRLHPFNLELEEPFLLMIDGDVILASSALKLPELYRHRT